MHSNNTPLMSEKKEEGNTTTQLNPTPTGEPSVIENDHSSSQSAPSRAPLASPSCSPDDRESQCSARVEIVSTTQLLFLIVKRTIVYVGGGIVFMLLGIGVLQAALLPKIFTCPPGATCADSYDPNTTIVLQLLQTVMGWWLQIGLIVAGFGLLRLSAYQSWFIMMKPSGNTIDNLDLTLGGIKGSLLDACRLVLRRGNVFISLLLLAQIGIGAAISLFVGLSIVRSPGDRTVAFSYLSISQLPDSSAENLNTDEQNRATSKVIGWALGNDTTHEDAMRGSLVVPDQRRNTSVNAQPGGPIISGSISCTPVPNNSITKNDTNGGYQIVLEGHEYNALPDMLLAVCFTNIRTSSMTYLWVSNTTGILPNATNTPDGVLYATLCDHDVFFPDAPERVPEVQYLEPNVPNVSGCRSQDEHVCAADSVSNAIFSWWGGKGQSFWKVACRGGVLGPLKAKAPYCALTNELWAETVTSMLDGIMWTSTRRGLDTQSLKARVETINSGRWWLQGVIPLLTLFLYFLTLAYTCYLSQGKSMLKKLNLVEIIEAAQTKHVKELLESGHLKKSTMRYDNGFRKDDA